MDTRQGKERRPGRDESQAGGAGARSLLAALAGRARQTTRGDGDLVEAMEVKAQGSLEEAQASIRAQMAQAQSRATASQKSLAGPEQRRLESLADRQSMPFGMLMRHFKALRAIPDTPERI